VVSESSVEELQAKLSRKYHEFHCPCMARDLSEECTCELGVLQKLAHEAVEEMADLDLRHQRLVGAASNMVEQEELIAMRRHKTECKCRGCTDLKWALEGEG